MRTNQIDSADVIGKNQDILLFALINEFKSAIIDLIIDELRNEESNGFIFSQVINKITKCEKSKFFQ